MNNTKVTSLKEELQDIDHTRTLCGVSCSSCEITMLIDKHVARLKEDMYWVICVNCSEIYDMDDEIGECEKCHSQEQLVKFYPEQQVDKHLGGLEE